MRIKRLHNPIGERHVNQLIAAYLGAFPQRLASGALRVRGTPRARMIAWSAPQNGAQRVSARESG